MLPSGVSVGFSVFLFIYPLRVLPRCCGFHFPAPRACALVLWRVALLTCGLFDVVACTSTLCLLFSCPVSVSFSSFMRRATWRSLPPRTTDFATAASFSGFLPMLCAVLELRVPRLCCPRPVWLCVYFLCVCPSTRRVDPQTSLPVSSVSITKLLQLSKRLYYLVWSKC
ncbi:hypothetical protein TRVL_05004 [Trypanosoma vivax]|nr:hypothetical protein TRVL_05004 [Trypanosoma vivax]